MVVGRLTRSKIKNESRALGNSVSQARDFRFQVLRPISFLLCLIILLESGCGTSDAIRLKESRNAYLKDDFQKSEASLFTPEVLKESKNRLQHFYFLASVAMSEGQFEKAIYFLVKARDSANSLRSSSGTFEWFSKDYLSNPIEYSYIHSMLVMAYSVLAEQGNSPAWSTPEIKDEKGGTLIQVQAFPARSYTPREVAEFKKKARAELLAWDTFLQTLRNTYPTEKYYKEDLWARMLASYIQGSSSDLNEKRTAQILAGDMQKIFDKEFIRYPSANQNHDQIEAVIQKLKDHASGKGQFESLLVCEAGVMSQYKIQRFRLGLSTLFGQIKDPGLRRAIEQVGMQVLINEAPEFGLIALGGAIAGSVGGGVDSDDSEHEDPPKYFTDAIDRSFGFEVRFPTLHFPAPDTKVTVSFLAPGGTAQDVSIPVVSPLQEIVANELKARQDSEMFAKAAKIGLEYVALLVPAVKAYKSTDNVFQKLAILAGYFLAKKAIDSANNPDLRSWSYLPKLIAADLIPLPAGEYDAKVTISNHFGREERSIGKVQLGNQNAPIVLKRVGDVSILNRF